MFQCLLALALHFQPSPAPAGPYEPYKGMLQAPSLPPLWLIKVNNFLPKLSDLGSKASWMFDEFGVPVTLTKRQKWVIKLNSAMSNAGQFDAP